MVHRKTPGLILAISLLLTGGGWCQGSPQENLTPVVTLILRFPKSFALSSGGYDSSSGDIGGFLVDDAGGASPSTDTAQFFNYLSSSGFHFVNFKKGLPKIASPADACGVACAFYCNASYKFEDVPSQGRMVEAKCGGTPDNQPQWSVSACGCPNNYTTSTASSNPYGKNNGSSIGNSPPELPAEATLLMRDVWSSLQVYPNLPPRAGSLFGQMQSLDMNY